MGPAMGWKTLAKLGSRSSLAQTSDPNEPFNDGSDLRSPTDRQGGSATNQTHKFRTRVTLGLRVLAGGYGPAALRPNRKFSDFSRATKSGHSA